MFQCNPKNLSYVSFIHLRCFANRKLSLSQSTNMNGMLTRNKHINKTLTLPSLPLSPVPHLYISLSFSLLLHPLFLSISLLLPFSLSLSSLLSTKIMFLGTEQTILLNIGQTILKICSTSFCLIWQALIISKKSHNVLGIQCMPLNWITENRISHLL